MRSKKLGIIGASGRMGKNVADLTYGENEWELSLGLSRREVFGFQRCEESLNCVEASVVDVLVDFSLPDISLEAIKWAARMGKPIVSGTTGFTNDQWSEIRACSEQTRILWAPNMSFGMAVFKKALESFSFLSDFDFQIHEIHHNKKKDSPSGTALMLQEELGKVVKKSLPPVLASRGGGVLGTHQVCAMGDEEVITFCHEAIDRKVFARGALRAASWLFSQKKNGLYCLEDVLNSLKNT